MTSVTDPILLLTLEERLPMSNTSVYCLACGAAHSVLPANNHCQACGKKLVLDLAASPATVVHAALSKSGYGREDLKTDLRRAAVVLAFVVAAMGVIAFWARSHFLAKAPEPPKPSPTMSVAWFGVYESETYRTSLANELLQQAQSLAPCVKNVELPQDQAPMHLDLSFQVTFSQNFNATVSGDPRATPAHACLREALLNLRVQPTLGAALQVNLSIQVDSGGTLILPDHVEIH